MSGDERTGADRRWTIRCAAVVLLAVPVTTGLTEPAAVVLAVMAAALGTWGGWEWRRARNEQDPGARPVRPSRTAFRAGLGAAVAVLAVAGLVVFTGAAAWPLLGVLLVLGLAWHVWRRRSATDATVEETLTELDTATLCRRWERSDRALQLARDTTVVAAIVDLRSAYLDEMERRDPSGFRRWLGSSARMPADPIRFLT